MKDKDTTRERTRAKAVQGHTSSEFGDSYLVFAVSFLEKGLERELAASFLQMLETEFRRIGLILDREANELLCVIRQLIIGRTTTGLVPDAERTPTAYCRAMPTRWWVTLSRFFLSSARSLSPDFSFRISVSLSCCAPTCATRHASRQGVTFQGGCKSNSRSRVSVLATRFFSSFTACLRAFSLSCQGAIVSLGRAVKVKLKASVQRLTMASL